MLHDKFKNGSNFIYHTKISEAFLLGTNKGTTVSSLVAITQVKKPSSIKNLLLSVWQLAD